MLSGYQQPKLGNNTKDGKRKRWIELSGNANSTEVKTALGRHDGLPILIK